MIPPAVSDGLRVDVVSKTNEAQEGRAVVRLLLMEANACQEETVAAEKHAFIQSLNFQRHLRSSKSRALPAWRELVKVP